MFKTFILSILSISIFSSCSFNNPLSKKAELVYLDCPKSLILAPGKTIKRDNVNISLNKDYSVNCYFIKNNLNEVFFDFNYKLDLTDIKEELTAINLEFWVFITDKEETKKLQEEIFTKSIDLLSSIEKNEDPLVFNDTVIIQRSVYDKGLKIFLSLN